MRLELKPKELTLVLVAVNFVWRAAWLTTSHGAYTDGILQIDSFRYGLTYWPPLYTLVTMGFSWLPGFGLEGAARAVSVIAGTMTVIPIEAIGRRLFGRRAALMAVIAYTISPLALRWSVQVMTDSLFTMLWTFGLAAALMATEQVWPDLFAHKDSEPKPDRRKGFQFLLAASLCGVLATLTRYQGIFILPIVALMAYRIAAQSDRKAAGRRRPYLALLPWALIPFWLLRHGVEPLQRHFGTIAERTSSISTFTTFVNYWYTFEQFVLASPYFLTHGLFGFFLYGLFRMQFGTRRLRLGAWTALYLTLGILCLQSVYQAYQSRYLLPLVPLFCVGAGHGLAVWERHCRRRPALFWALAFPTFAYAILFASLTAFYQGDPFIDIKRAAIYLRDIPESARIFTTERYSRDIGPAKLTFWTGGRKIHMMREALPREGDYVVLPSVYGGLGGGGRPAYRRLVKEVLEVYPAKIDRVFHYYSYPLQPDIMEDPITHMNPLGWYLRYNKQRYETTILKVISIEEQMELLDAPSMESEAQETP